MYFAEIPLVSLQFKSRFLVDLVFESISSTVVFLPGSYLRSQFIHSGHSVHNHHRLFASTFGSHQPPVESNRKGKLFGSFLLSLYNQPHLLAVRGDASESFLFAHVS